MIDFDCDFLSLSKSKRSRYFRFLFLLCVFCLTWLRRGARGRRLPKSFSHCLQSSLRSNLRRAPDHGASVQRTSFRQSSRPVFVFVCCKCVFESCSVPPDLFTVAPGMNFGAWQVFFFFWWAFHWGLPARGRHDQPRPGTEGKCGSSISRNLQNDVLSDHTTDCSWRRAPWWWLLIKKIWC